MRLLSLSRPLASRHTQNHGLAGLGGILLLSASASTQGWQMAVSVAGSQLTTGGCQIASAALPPGPVLQPIAAVAGRPGLARASSAVTPGAIDQTPVLEFQLEARCAPASFAIGSLDLDLSLAAGRPGTQWLRVLWEGDQMARMPPLWTLIALPPHQFQWSEFRAGSSVYPVTVDVPLDLTLPAQLQLRFAGGVGSSTFCGHGGCTFTTESAGGRMTFALRATAPPAQTPFGVPCATRSGLPPITALFDPFGMPGRTDLEAVARLPVNAAALLLIGDSRDWFGTLPLPLDLTPLGAPGCSLLTNVVLALPTVSPIQGLTALALGPETALRGLAPLYFQWCVADPANALGLLFSNAIAVQVP